MPLGLEGVLEIAHGGGVARDARFALSADLRGGGAGVGTAAPAFASPTEIVR
jgi:hypothetical protein